MAANRNELITQVKGVIGFSLLSLSCLVIAILESLSLVFIKPISRVRHRKLVTFLTYLFMLNCPFMLQKWSKVKLIQHGDNFDPKSSALFLLNHRANADW